ncbi:coiled-coil domain-containing protein 81-like [Homalodisca vitripennis]|uniref:coiled-coil domain-containing protein 81-like n=1 Tax=Homalodisca vitripennis TaxID=197043 RepID=UPI001EEA7412|nr:coiled-coil domain-containing protein 81-like [Homalodisca vitripennis]
MTVDVIEEAINNYKPIIGRIYSVSDAQKVWDGVAQWIAAYLYKHKGVVVPGLGTFTLSEWALDTGLGKPLIISRPAFFITETLVQSFTIKQRQVFTANNVACHMIHYGGVAALAGLDRSTVKVCVQEVVQALKRLLWENKNLRLNLGVIGQLTICDKQVSLEYRRELLNKMRDLTEQRRSTIKPVYPWSPKRILE